MTWRTTHSCHYSSGCSARAQTTVPRARPKGPLQSPLLRLECQHNRAATAMAAGQGHSLVEGGLVIESKLTLQGQRDGETSCHRCNIWSALPGNGSSQIADAGPLEWIVAEQIQ